MRSNRIPRTWTNPFHDTGRGLALAPSLIHTPQSCLSTHETGQSIDGAGKSVDESACLCGPVRAVTTRSSDGNLIGAESVGSEL